MESELLPRPFVRGDQSLQSILTGWLPTCNAYASVKKLVLLEWQQFFVLKERIRFSTHPKSLSSPPPSQPLPPTLPDGTINIFIVYFNCT